MRRPMLAVITAVVLGLAAVTGCGDDTTPEGVANEDEDVVENEDGVLPEELEEEVEGTEGEAPTPLEEEAIEGDPPGDSGDFAVAVVEDLSFPEGTSGPAPLTVEYQNADDVPHTVTSIDAEIDEELPPGGSVAVTFPNAGTWNVICTIHPTMATEVVAT